MRVNAVPLIAILVSSGCYYGAMQGARTLGDGHASIRGSLMMPAFTSSADRVEAEETGEDYLDPYPSFTFAVGASPEIDLGLTVMGYGIGPFIKYGFLDPGSDIAFSALGGVNYVMPPQVVSPRASLAFGKLLGRDLEVYGGWECGYGPDLANIPEDEYGDNDWDTIDNTFFHALKAGCVYTIKSEAGEDDFGMFVPELIGFEFSIPLDMGRNLVIAGLSIGY